MTHRNPVNKRDYDLSRKAAMVAMYQGAFSVENVVSDSLFVAIDSAMKIGLMRRDAPDLLLWLKKQENKVLDEILLIGLSRAIKSARRRKFLGASGTRSRAITSTKVAALTREKARSFDRIVEMLDHLDVNGKVLGDCTRADLLRAAVRLEQQAEDSQVRAALYRQLADVVGKGTVREASGRGQIVALLTATFQEAA